MKIYFGIIELQIISIIMPRLVIVGDGGVGKTAFIKRNLSNFFEKRYIPTVGVKVHVIENFTVWDTAGQEKYNNTSSFVHYIRADIGIIMFDVTAKNTFRSVSFWIREIRSVNQRAKIILVANKVDIVVGRKVSREDIIEVCQIYGVPCLELSCKSDAHVGQVIEAVHNEAIPV